MAWYDKLAKNLGFTTEKQGGYYYDHVPLPILSASLSAIAELQNIDSETILQNPTAFAAIDTIAKTIAQQPFQVVQDGKVDNEAYPLGLLQRPNEFTSSYEMKYQLVLDLITNGRAFVEMRRATNGTVRSWRIIPPRMIKVDRDSNGNTILTLRNTITDLRYVIDNVLIENVTMIRDVSASQIPQGLSRTTLLRRLVALDNAIDTFALALFNRQLSFGNYAVVLPEFLPVGQEENIMRRLEEQFQGVHANKAGSTPLLEGGIKIEQIPAMKPSDADMSALKQRTQSQITGAIGVPAPLIELNNGNANYNNVAQRYTGFYRDTLNPMSINICQKLDRAFGLPPGVNIQLDGTEIIKGDLMNQVSVATSAFRNNFWTMNEARAFTGQPTVDDGDVFMSDIDTVPSNTTGIEDGVEDENT